MESQPQNPENFHPCVLTLSDLCLFKLLSYLLDLTSCLQIRLRVGASPSSLCSVVEQDT